MAVAKIDEKDDLGGFSFVEIVQLFEPVIDVALSDVHGFCEADEVVFAIDELDFNLFGDRQQRCRECDPAVCPGKKKLVVQCLGQGREGQCQSVLADRDRQGQRTGALCLSPVSVHRTA